MSLLSPSMSRSLSGSLAPESFPPAASRPSIARSPQLPSSGRQQRRPARSLVVKAQLQDQGRAAAVLTAVKDSCTKFLGRYDPVTTGIGSLLVTGYCVVVHGQDVGEALNIAAFATILGMVMQEVLFHDESKPENPA